MVMMVLVLVLVVVAAAAVVIMVMVFVLAVVVAAAAIVIVVMVVMLVQLFYFLRSCRVGMLFLFCHCSRLLIEITYERLLICSYIHIKTAQLLCQ